MSRLVQIIILGSVWLNLVQSSAAQGTIQYFRPDAPIQLHTEFFAEYLPVDFDGDANPELTFAYDFHFIGVRSEGNNRILTWMSPPPNIGGSVAPIAAGFAIGSESESGALQWFGRIPGVPYDLDFNTLIQTFNTGSGGAFVGQHAYMGVELQRGGNTHYGWMLLQIGDVGAFGRIDSWAWETRSGVPIFAGAVPEPSALALFSAGIVLLTLRRREQIQFGESPRR